MLTFQMLFDVIKEQLSEDVPERIRFVLGETVSLFPYHDDYTFWLHPLDGDKKGFMLTICLRSKKNTTPLWRFDFHEDTKIVDGLLFTEISENPYVTIVESPLSAVASIDLGGFHKLKIVEHFDFQSEINTDVFDPENWMHDDNAISWMELLRTLLV